jgi:hypothetical protein
MFSFTPDTQRYKMEKFMVLSTFKEGTDMADV